MELFAGLVDWSKVPLQFGLVGLAFFLCSLIGMERQFQHKSAGIRTHALVGLGSSVFTLISVEGFVGLAEYHVTRDPSRISAQIVSGIGFLGAGVIFVNRDVVRGLTTAASIWLAAAIGMACGAGLLPLAMFATVLHFVAVLVIAPLARLIPRAGERSTVAVTYEDGRGVLRQVLAEAAALGCETTLSSTKTATTDGTRMVRAEMRFRSGPALRDVMAQLADVPGVVGVELAGRNDEL
ncbi:MgtC/SapB family protein [Tessaracoccus oleiagri]|uniref:Putative Mg2+ transporter-C (MgtC) family protein n=1 Tax=Tessaracoccus oleiagri TaxID=686624 RepID=A0A1G9JF76_9ACTN|nr:MgtC/SapB family protein [Tessaracoccus oleiagri]SDL35952.1 putative Mg2+ transporter-C (MgtC) family protein [Tessaracoccus oleiagri]